MAPTSELGFQTPAIKRSDGEQPCHPRHVKAPQKPAQSLPSIQQHDLMLFTSSCEPHRTFVWIYESSAPLSCAQMALIHSALQKRDGFYPTSQFSCYFCFKTLKETFFKSRPHFFLSGESSSLYKRRSIILLVRRDSSSNLQQSWELSPAASQHGCTQRCSHSHEEFYTLPPGSQQH